ncbi:eukaryotic translation initiation factor eif1a-like protein [Niveomyces insectorum RCEF 264]|uniref:Eukaryotic translation initiation factor eif1a-like protein n=1 Tax=Niveomyces insectorum RCEF 264 TaxID=1081102 RepID=A0A167YWL1_9HYPO|nr:eukaryotic translation initiation factor eif1a-like protein [Niveomyces insectorum RCEF 264]
MARSRRTLHAALEDSATPPETLTSTQSVARVVQAEGNSLYTCLLPTAATVYSSNKVLVELNARFRNTVYMRRGGYVLVDLAAAAESQQAGRKVLGEIVNVVRDEKAWRKQAYWPTEFAKTAYDEASDDESNVGKLPPSDSEEDDEE